MRRSICQRTVMGLFALIGLHAWGATKYVDIGKVGGDYSGSSWDNASTNLAATLDGASLGDQIWVAQGTYFPSNGTDRQASFRPRDRMELYGGFTNGMTALGQRNWTDYPTILSGNIGDPASPADNCHRVIVVRGTNVVLDGFTITGGFSDTSVSAPTNYGCAIYTFGGSQPGAERPKNLTLANCIISNNATAASAVTRGGALHFGTAGTNNLIRNCLFVGNTNAFIGAAIYCTDQTSLKVIGSTFRDNRNESSCIGGAIAMHNMAAVSYGLTVSNCIFAGNVSGNAAGIYAAGCAVNLSDSVFVNNSTLASAPAAIQFRQSAVGVVDRCIISSNNGYRGAAICIGYANSPASPSSVTVRDTLIAGNSDSYEGAGAYLDDNSTGVFVNCSFVGNYASQCGAGVRVKTHAGTKALLKNCTLAGNKAGTSTGGGAIYVSHGGFAGATNCIVWNNAPYEWRVDDSTNAVAYTDLKNGLAGITNISSLVTDGGGNLNTNPLFGAEVTGTWTANGVYNADTFKTTLTDTNATWTPGVHVGKTVEVKANDIYQFVIVTNSATNLTVWGNVARAASGNVYRIVDLHEQSRVGRWTPLGWAVDTAHSPCIDAGDGSAYALEPTPNGRRINMGRYGNTAQASLSIPFGTVVTIR